MSYELIWQLPVGGDARYGTARLQLRGERGRGEAPFRPGVTDPRGGLFNHFDYLHQVARAAELSGFDGVRVPHDPSGDESWIIAGYIARGTRSLKIIAEFEASWGSAVYAAKNAVSFQRYTGGRLAWQLSPGAHESQRRRVADPVVDGDVLARIEEFLVVARGVTAHAPFSFEGRFFEVREGGFRGTLSNHRAPEVYLSGDSDEALEASARHADVHVFSAASADELKPRVSQLRESAGRQARVRRAASLAAGVRLDILARETREEAVFDATRLAEQGGVLSAASSLLWPGLTARLGGADATVVGSYDEVVERLSAYAASGVSRFLLGGAPHLEEAYRLGTFVLPALRRRLASLAAA